jgi:hypothetical protein
MLDCPAATPQGSWSRSIIIVLFIAFVWVRSLKPAIFSDRLIIPFSELLSHLCRKIEGKTGDRNLRAAQSPCRKTITFMLTLAAGGAMAAPLTVANAAVSPTDLVEIASAVDGVINAAKAGLPNDAGTAEIDAAVASAIASETEQLLSHSDDPIAVAEAVITAASQGGASALAIGGGLAQTALAEKGRVGPDIAAAIGGAGTVAALDEFVRVTDKDRSDYGRELASIAESSVEIGAGGNGGGAAIIIGGGGTGTGGGTGGGGGGGCTNPSCT